MFFHSQTEVEQRHIINALRFELGKCMIPAVRERVLYLLSHIDGGLAEQVAVGLGLDVPKKIDGYLNQNYGADADPKVVQPKKFTGTPHDSPALSIVRSTKPGMETAKVAVLVADGFDEAGVKSISQAVAAAGGQAKVIAPHGGVVVGDKKGQMPVDFSLPTVCSVLFDAVYVAGGQSCVDTLKADPRAVDFVEEAHKHCKAIAATGGAVAFLESTKVAASIEAQDPAIVTGDRSNKQVADAFLAAISQHRNWARELTTLPNG